MYALKKIREIQAQTDKNTTQQFANNKPKFR